PRPPAAAGRCGAARRPSPRARARGAPRRPRRGRARPPRAWPPAPPRPAASPLRAPAPRHSRARAPSAPPRAPGRGAPRPAPSRASPPRRGSSPLRARAFRLPGAPSPFRRPPPRHRRALSCRVERSLLGLQTLARRAPRQLFGRRALAHRRGRLDLGLGPLARVLRGFFLLLAAALGQRRGLLLRFLARFRLGGRLRFGALALGDHARRLRLGLGARIGNAPQLDFRRLALARHVQPALLLAQLGLRRLAGAALGLDAVALHSGALAVRLLQLVEQLAHLLDLALGLAGEKSRLIMSPRESE